MENRIKPLWDYSPDDVPRNCDWLNQIKDPNRVSYRWYRKEYEEWCSGKSFAEIARRLGLSPCRIRQRIYKFVYEARARIRFEKLIRDVGVKSRYENRLHQFASEWEAAKKTENQDRGA